MKLACLGALIDWGTELITLFYWETFYNLPLLYSVCSALKQILLYKRLTELFGLN